MEECEVFEFAAGRRESIPGPSAPRVSPDLVALGGKLYLAGRSSRRGGASLEPHPSVGCFDPSTGRWSLVIEAVPLPPVHVRMLPFPRRRLLLSIHVREEQALTVLLLAPGAGAETPERF